MTLICSSDMSNIFDVAGDVLQWLASRECLGVPSLEDDLYRDGFLDSFGLVELIVFCESRYGVTFEDSDFANPAFRTLGGLAEIVTQRGGSVLPKARV